MGGVRAKVLIVEDDHMNKVLVKEILGLNGYDIIEAKSGIEAVRLMATERPDIVLMDIHLPEMDGITATRIIKADERNSTVPVLALTASAMKGDEENILSKGFDGYVAKPIDVKRLVSMIKSALEGRRKAD